MRLIDADAIYNKAVENRQNGEIEDWEADSIIDYLDGAPTINDAEIVVRCKDCKLWDSDPDTYGKDTGPEGKCMKSFERMPADGFCSYGEKGEK